MDWSASLAAILESLVARVGLDFRHEWLLQGLAFSATDQVAFGLVLVQPSLRVDGLVKPDCCTGLWHICQRASQSRISGAGKKAYEL
jgi:hypothetical protein